MIYSSWSTVHLPGRADRYNPDLYDLAHATGWAPYSLPDLPDLPDLWHLSWVGSVLYRSYTAPQNARLVSTVDDLSDLSVANCCVLYVVCCLLFAVYCVLCAVCCVPWWEAGTSNTRLKMQAVVTQVLISFLYLTVAGVVAAGPIFSDLCSSPKMYLY